MSSVKFDSQELVGSTYIPRFVKHESNPDREINSAELTGEDGNVFISTRWGKKIIKVQGILTGSTQNELEDNIDDFKELFAREEKNLDIGWNGTTRRYVATCIKHDFDRDYFNLLFVPWTAEFVVLSGEGKDTTESTAYNDTIVSSGDYASVTVPFLGGKGPRPTIRLTLLNTQTAFPAEVLGAEIKNNDTGDRVILTKNSSWDGTEYLEFDFANKVVKSNFDGSLGNNDFYGSFSKFKIGNNALKIKFGGISCQECVPAALYQASDTIKADTKRIAQSFMVPKTDTTFKGLSLFGYRTGTPGDLKAEIYADSGNHPTGSALATITFPYEDFGTSSIADWITKYAASVYSLTADTKYWILLYVGTGGADNSNYYTIYTAGADTYLKGNLATSTDSGSTYTNNLNDDLDFKLLFGGGTGAAYATCLIKYYKTYL